MKTKFAALALSTTLLLALGACSKKDEPVATSGTTIAPAGSSTSAAADGSSTTAGAGGSTTTKPKADGTSTTKKSPGTTEPDDTDTTEDEEEELTFTADEEACLEDKKAAAEADPEYQNGSEEYQAGFQGGAIAECVDKAKIAAVIRGDIAELEPDYTSEQLDCIEGELVKFDSDELGLVIAGFILDNQALFADAKEKIGAKC